MTAAIHAREISARPARKIPIGTENAPASVATHPYLSKPKIVLLLCKYDLLCTGIIDSFNTL
jgi:hypothetical protein